MINRLPVSAIVVAYKSHAYIGACISSLVAAGVGQIIVVDGNEDDCDLAVLQECSRRFSGMKLIRGCGNIGFGAAVNLGVAATEAPYADYLWIVNPDTAVGIGSAETLVATLASNSLDIVSPLIWTGSSASPVVWFSGGRFSLESGSVQHSDAGAPLTSVERTGLVESDFITGTAPMFTASAWRRLEGFREDLFLYWEDVDICVRALRESLRLGVNREARVWHAEGGSSSVDAGRSTTFYYYTVRNRILVGRENDRIFSWTIGAGFGETCKSLARPILRERDGRFAKFRAALAGVRDGYASRYGRR